MQPILRTASKPLRTLPRRFPTPTLAQQPRFASSDYGSKQSGHEQGTDQKNPRVDLEHPGPDAPSAAKKGASQNQASGQSKSSSEGGSPAIHQPKSAAESEDPEVRKHNEELNNRYEKTANQLSEKDNKVDKNFWKGVSLPTPNHDTILTPGVRRRWTEARLNTTSS
jgi:hypothetical protein